MAIRLLVACVGVAAYALVGLGNAHAAGSVLYVDNTSPSCSNTGSGTALQPFCSIGAAASRVTAGQTVQVGGTTYPEKVTVSASGTVTARIVFVAAPGTTPTLTGGTDGFLVTGSYVTIQGFSVTHTSGDGIVIQNASNVLVSGNHASYSGQPVLNEAAHGIRFVTVSNSIVEQNTVDHNTAYGIYIDVSSTGNIIRLNNCFQNAFGYQRAASGIRIHTSSDNTISSNWSHNNEDSGMDLDKSTDNVVVDNLFTNNGDHGVDVTASSFRTTVTGNTVYKSVTAGINFEGTSTGTVTNNISVDNGIASPRTHSDIRVDVGSTTGVTVDYNEAYLTTPDMLYIWGSSSYSSLAAFQAATGQEAHGIQADPKWANIAGDDFHLTAGSPAIDSANSNAPTQTAVDAEGFARMDDPVTPNTGAGVRAYDDRGALEYHAGALDHIVVSPANATLTAGSSLSVSAEGYDAAGNDIGNVTGSATFTIGPNGSCTGTSCTATQAGPHTVTATVAGVSGATTLTVNPAALDHLVLSPASATIISRGTVTYTADGRDQYNNSTGDVTATTTFTISPNGSCTRATCTASKAGGHTVTGTKSGKTGTASLQVLAGSINHIVISPATATISAGGGQAYTAQSFDSAGNPLGDVTSSTTFSIPDGSCTANVCTATTVGSHTVTGVNSGKTSTATLTVTAGPLDHLALSPASATVAAGSTQAYTAQGRDAYDNSLGDVTSSTTFTVAPDGSCAGASCTATLAGPHTVTGSSGGKTGSASLQVTANGAIARIVITPAPATIAAGGSQKYMAQGYDAAGNAIGDVTANTTFSIGPDGSCTGNTCTATTAGAHTVTGTAGSATTTASLTVTAAALDHIVLTPASATISAGGSQSYSAEGRDQYNNSLGDITDDATFTIAPDGSCTTGNTCTASTAGAHTVTATRFAKTGTASLQVTGGNLDHIVLSPAAATISAGGSQTYSVEGFDSAGNSLGDFTLATTLTISPDGSCTGSTCTATTVGDHTVTAINNGETSSAVLTVTAGALDHLVVSPGSATIVPGGSQTYTAYGRDQYDNPLGNETAITTFTIAPDGLCTGNTCTASVNGTHTVTATVDQITGSGTLQVTPAAAIDHIVVSPASATIAAGDLQTYTAEAFDSSSNSLGDVTGSTTFTIGPDGSCSGNVCTATKAGAHTVTGTAVGKTSTASLSMTAGPLDHLVLAPATAVIAPGAAETYTAEGRDQYNNSLGDITANTTFTIAPDGSCILATCTALLDGAHTVTGTSLGALGTATLTVSSEAVDHIVISPASASITAGGSQTYTAEAFDSSNNSLGDVTGSATFTIAPDGSCTGNTCTATTAGSHTVTGSSGGNTSNASLSVTAAPLHHLVLSPASAMITSGGSQTYTAQGRDQYDNSLGDVTASTTFTISPNGSCTGATCTASTAGTHTVTGNDGGKTGTASLQVSTATLDHIVISPATATITAGGSKTYTAQGFDAANNSLGDVTATTTFTISPNGSCTGATCTATVAGSHTVTGTDAGKTSSATLTVTAGPLDHLALSPATATITAGSSQAYTAQGRDQYNNSLGDVTAATTFTISPDGSCTGATCSATTSGAHTVTGSDGGKTGTALLQVNVGPLDHLALSPVSATITAGGSQTYTAQGRDQYDNSLGNVTANTTFTIAPDGSCTGASCTATAGGAHTVTGTDAGKTGTATLTVDASSIDHIVISPATGSITAGGSQIYTAQAFDASNNSLGDVTPGTTFTISPDGSCTGATCTATVAGSHTVTGTDAGKTSNATLSVNPGPLHHLALSPASAAIPAGGSQTYTAQGRDQYDNSLGDVTANTTFTITPNGSCTGATCTVSATGAHTVTGNDGGKTGTASLEVASGMLDHIVISPSSATITAGGSQTYTAQAFDAANNLLGDVTANTIFTIVPDQGCTGATCTATIAGSHTVTGTYAGKTSSAHLNVTAGPLDHLALSPASATITSGGSQAYTADARDQYNNSLGDITSSTTFTIAPDGSCVAALCIATTVGPHTVTGTTVGATGTASLQVNAAALDHLTLSPASATISAGGSQTYTAQGFDASNNSLGDVTSGTTITLAPNGSCTGATCTATVGGPHTVTGTNGGKSATASLNVNFVRNPGFETDLSGWNTSGSGANVTLTRVSGGHSGGWAALLTNTGSTTTSFATLQDAPNWVTVTSAGTYTGSLWVRAATAGAVLKLKFQEYSGATLVGSALTQATLTTSWQQVTVNYAIKSPGSTLDLQAFVANAAPGAVFYVDDASILQSGGAVDHIVISPATATITAGGSNAYTAQAFDAANNSLGDVTSSTTFTISPNGSCTAAACTATVAGSHTVTGTYAGKTSSATLTVNAGALDHLALSPASAAIPAGGSQTYTAQGRDQYDNSLGDVTANTTFTINPNGSCTGATCTATVAGSHTVTGTDAGKTGTASLQVNAAALDHLVLSPASATINSGGSQTYTAQGRDQYDNSLGDVTANTTFTISPNGSCTGAGCTATTLGAHTVTGTDAGKTGTASLQVTTGGLDHIVISPASATITAGASQAYTAEGFDASNNSLGDVTGSTTFTISPNGSCTGSTCTAMVAGPHTVTGTDAGKTSNATLTVNAGPLDHLALSPASGSIGAGGSQTYTAQGRDQYDNSLGDVTANTTFTIGPDGSCTGASCTATTSGAHTVTGTDAGKTGTASLQVNAGALDHLVLSPASATISPGGSQRYTAQGRDQYDNSMGDVTANTTFTIGPDGSCTGATCTATTTGAHTVTGTNAGKTGTATLTVDAATVDHIVISPASASISAGGSQTYTAQAFDASNHLLGDVTASTTFTISPDGSCMGATCTATAAGPHTVTGTNSGKTSNATLTVSAGPLDHLALSPASASINAGSSQTYTAQGRDQYDNSLGDVTANTTFTISPNGSCTGATCTASASGAHTVTGTDGGKTGTASLQVTGGALDHIVLTPASATISSGGSQTYTAQGFDASNNSLGDVTSGTVFTIAPNGSCTAATCTATVGGPHTVTGTNSGRTATATLNVNFVRNPGFETDLSGWNTSGSGANVTLTRVAGGHSGGSAALLTNTGTTATTFATLQDSPNWVTTTTAGTYTGSLWVRADTAGAIVKLKFQEYSGATLVGSALAQVTLTTSWQQVTVTYAIKSPGSTLDFQAFVQNAAPGTAFYADDAAIFLG